MKALKPKFKKGDLVKFVFGFNGYGNSSVIKELRLVTGCSATPGYVDIFRKGSVGSFWYTLYPPHHLTAEPEYGLELIVSHEEG